MGLDTRAGAGIDLGQHPMNERMAKLGEERLEPRAVTAQARIPGASASAVGENLRDQGKMFWCRDLEHEASDASKQIRAA